MRENIVKWSQGKKRDPRMEAVAKEFIRNLEIEFPNNGTDDRWLCLANLLHPFFKGYPLRMLNAEKKTIQDMIDRHPTTIDWQQQQADLRQMDLAGNDEMEHFVLTQSQEDANVSVRLQLK